MVIYLFLGGVGLDTNATAELDIHGHLAPGSLPSFSGKARSLSVRIANDGTGKLWLFEPISPRISLLTLREIRP